jgi:hypothetical protein
VELAIGVVAGSQKLVGVAKAIELVGFLPKQVKSMKLYQQVRRKAQRLCIVEKVTTPLPVDVVVPPTEEAMGRSIASSLMTKRR